MVRRSVIGGIGAVSSKSALSAILMSPHTHQSVFTTTSCCCGFINGVTQPTTRYLLRFDGIAQIPCHPTEETIW